MVAIQSVFIGGEVTCMRVKNRRCEMKILYSIIVLGLFSVVSTVQADFRRHSSYETWDPINRAQHKMQRRIEHGLNQGLISPRELRKLNRQQRKIAHLEYKFKRDGYLDFREQKILQHKIDKAHQTISAFKNDRRRPYNYRRQNFGMNDRYDRPKYW